MVANKRSVSVRASPARRAEDRERFRSQETRANGFAYAMRMIGMSSSIVHATRRKGIILDGGDANKGR